MLGFKDSLARADLCEAEFFVNGLKLSLNSFVQEFVNQGLRTQTRYYDLTNHPPSLPYHLQPSPNIDLATD